jgi:hypothetical protein
MVAVAKVVEYKPRTIRRARAGSIRAVHGCHQESEDNGRKIDRGRKENGWKEVNVVKNNRCVDHIMSSSKSAPASYSYRTTRVLAGCDE